MTLTRRQLVAALALALALVPLARALPARAETTLSPQAAALVAVLDSLGVEQKWIAGSHVNWETGAPDGDPEPLPAHHTHCSAFVAAAAKRLGVYILRPPEHGQILLSNAQADWLAGPGAAQGWRALPDAAAAVAAANRAELVVAVYKNPDPHVPGHVAIVRPTRKSAAEIAADGPEIIMAGVKNWQAVTEKAGFAAHPGAFAGHAIRYYAHAIPAAALAG